VVGDGGEVTPDKPAWSLVMKTAAQAQ